MRPLLRVFLVAVVLPAGGVVPSAGQAVQAPGLEAIWEAYQNLDYEAARTMAQAALEAYTQREDLAEVHLILGLIEFSQNAQVQARIRFATALGLNPAVELDSLLVSPKILSVFDEVRQEVAQARQDDTPIFGAVEYKFVEDQRAGAALRSMVLPGWGQLHKGERTKGRLLLGVWGAAVAGSLTAHLLREDARSAYLDAQTPGEAVDLYSSYNRWHRTRGALLLATAGVWIYSYIDALITDSRPQDSSRLRVGPTFSDRQMHLTVRVRF